MNFNPRSSCEERLEDLYADVLVNNISIHAPHARSDNIADQHAFILVISIHAPHARSDGGGGVGCLFAIISIHAPHARSDFLTTLMIIAFK